MLERKVVARIGVPLTFCFLFFGLQSLLIAKEKAPSQDQVIVADGGASQPLPFIAQLAKSANSDPQSLYNQSWKLIKDQYYDQKFNGQNWSRWQHHYDTKLKTMDDSHKAIETMLASLADPYTRFLDKEAFTEEKDQIEAHLFGVGMQLGMNFEHKVVVIAPILDTPASQAGMMSGDEIVEVDGKSIKGQSLDQVVKQIRGPIATEVEIGFLRKGERKKVKLKRAEIPIKAVTTAEYLPGNIGYIRLESFISNKATDEIKKALNQLKNADGIILDLRHNPGGLLTNAIEMAGLFLPEKSIIVSTIDADGYKQSQAVVGQPSCTLPLVVLINKGSASASEILSGALRDNGRAKLVGEKSFGKGLVQAINRLSDGSGINVTIAKYLTPNDTDIHKTGIVPDFQVKVDDEIATDTKDKDRKEYKGPWWIDVTMKEFKKRSPNDGKDIQLLKAQDVLREEIAKIHTANPSGPKASVLPSPSGYPTAKD
ncbi:MAG: S41 family peptidase [Candidatus Obscuribacter sp.]|nr:S41 family peptidase [Candidatus Melainabacteria bacterium]MDX1990407.1 S41 family peptidase [Candidatus Obscuribacter sp.]